MKINFLWIGILFFIWSCSSKKVRPDAYGNFEVTETIVGAQANGMLRSLRVREGDSLAASEIVGYVDTSIFHLQKEELRARITALQSQLPQASVQLQVLSEQISHARQEQTRIENLLAAQAATPKQRDDIHAEVSLLQKKYTALASSLSIQSQSILAQIKPLEIQMELLNQQISNSVVTNPVRGMVLSKYAEANEIVSYGKPLYSIGDLSKMILRAYVTGDQLPLIKIGQDVTILTDAPEHREQRWAGKITWIADEAEFTPKQIQTKDERANLVYAVKIAVPNDGTIKIGMPGEVLF